MTYAEWIADYERRHKHMLLGRCESAAREMHAAFRELRIVRGHVFDGQWGQRGHWWLETSEGIIIDPTAGQFPMLYEYEEWAPGAEVRVGRCMNCGEDIMTSVDSLENVASQSFCNVRCYDAAAAELNAL